MVEAQELNERERQILHAVVHMYITTAEPVGSRSVVKRFNLDLSPATVRNTMADLEELGFLQQVHTSSGRVPTDKGYRYYVDYLMRVQELTLSERERIEHELASQLQDADDVLRQTSHLLALVSHQAGLAEAPAENVAEIQRLELIPLSDRRLAVLMVDNFGRVRTLPTELEKPLAANEISVLNRFLNETLRGLTVDNVAAAMETKMRAALDEQRRLAEQAMQLMNVLPAQRHGVLYLEGATQLFEQPEFQDIVRAREVLGLLEERDRLGEMLRTAFTERASQRLSVLIGSESNPRGVEGISLIASPYKVNGRPVGMIGVLGPRRMPYSHLSSLVDFTAGLVGRILTRLGR
ncbi:MAG: heat-inducible transcription repressor HrcA [Candidatus Hydrogenedentes bacterium]|nr:heat-inducible transcription repressor HrcA [Candidatus Hydrogenedentota bacterium]